MKAHFNINWKRIGNGRSNDQLSRMFSSMSFREETWREKMDTRDTGRAPGLSSPLILAVPSSLTPELLRKHLRPLHWARAAISVGLRPQCTLCLPRAELEREEWSCPRVATGLMAGYLRSPLTSFPETFPGSP